MKDTLNELALFAGAGGGILGGKILGWRTVCAVELDDYARQVLIERQNDGCLAPFPIWDDIRTFDGRPWRGVVDVISGGFPCQDISCAGKGAGIDGERSGLWREMFRVVCEVGPRFVFVENSPVLTSRGLGRVLGDLASVGYDAEWCVLGADDVGASHERKRIFIEASNSNGSRLEGCKRWSAVRFFKMDNLASLRIFPQHKDDLPKPALLGKRHGMATRMERYRAIGNGQVPAVAALAFRILMDKTETET